MCNVHSYIFFILFLLRLLFFSNFVCIFPFIMFFSSIQSAIHPAMQTQWLFWGRHAINLMYACVCVIWNIPNFYRPLSVLFLESLGGVRMHWIVLLYWTQYGVLFIVQNVESFTILVQIIQRRQLFNQKKVYGPDPSFGWSKYSNMETTYLHENDEHFLHSQTEKNKFQHW